ncbi:DUF456 domain-containing protein [Candidatus Nanopelagicales bacterium]|nr:DUF456 domain-containing protein [Candidatus Nanopelagicales bacterium]
MGLDILAGLAILLGVAGTIVPLVPGVALVGAIVGIWAYANGVWWLLALAVVLTSLALAAKYVLPARAARDEASIVALAVGAVLAIVGFFVIPVVGFVVGFIGGVFVTELIRLRDLSTAWGATWATLKSVGVAMLIEFGAAAVMAVAWFGVVVLG